MNEQPTVVGSAGVGGVEGKPWIRATSYWMPRHIVESAWLEHAPFAFWLVDALCPRSIVELGTHNGFSYFVFCEAVARMGLSTRTFALDSWLGDDQAGYYGEDVFHGVATINEAEYAKFSTLLKGYFDDSLDSIPDRSIDLLHIDGRHGYDDVRHDFEAWRTKLSDRGVVLFHDIAERMEGFGVWQYWSEISRQFPSFAFDHEHGLGVLAVGTHVPEAMHAFLDAAGRHSDLIRADYQTLGAAVSRQFQIESLANETERLRGELQQAAQQLEAQNREIDLQRSDLAGLRNLVDEMHNSASWRVTGPLRAASNLVHRRKP